MAQDGTSPIVRAGGSLDAVVNRGVEIAPTGLSAVDQLRLRVAWNRHEGWLRNSEPARKAWQRQFTSDPDVSSEMPICLGQAVLKGTDGKYYGLHQITVPGVRGLSIYATPEDAFGTVLSVTETSINGKEQDASGERPLPTDEALKRFWDALGAFPDTGKWKLPEQGVSRLGPVRGITKALNEGYEILGSPYGYTFAGLPFTKVEVVEPGTRGKVITEGIATYLEEAMRDTSRRYSKGISGGGFGYDGEFSCDLPPVPPSVFDIFVRKEGGKFWIRELPGDRRVDIGLSLGTNHFTVSASASRYLFAAVEKWLGERRTEEARMRASGDMLSGGRYGDPYLFHGENIAAI